MRILTTVVRTSAALLCAVALAAILVSPVVPSPPTVVGKAVQASVTAIVVMFLPPPCDLAKVVMGSIHRSFEAAVLVSGSGVASAIAPLRR